jgi:hypothetical protein
MVQKLLANILRSFLARRLHSYIDSANNPFQAILVHIEFLKGRYSLCGHLSCDFNLVRGRASLDGIATWQMYMTHAGNSSR